MAPRVRRVSSKEQSMSMPVGQTYSSRPRALDIVPVWCCIALAAILARRRPATIVATLTILARIRPRRLRPPPVPMSSAERAYGNVCALSRRCASHDGCLRRSIAVYLRCVQLGLAPTWRSGFRVDPFASHAWVEVAGEPVLELNAIHQYMVTLSAPHP